MASLQLGPGWQFGWSLNHLNDTKLSCWAMLLYGFMISARNVYAACCIAFGFCEICIYMPIRYKQPPPLKFAGSLLIGGSSLAAQAAVSSDFPDFPVCGWCETSRSYWSCRGHNKSVNTLKTENSFLIGSSIFRWRFFVHKIIFSSTTKVAIWLVIAPCRGFVGQGPLGHMLITHLKLSTSSLSA